MDINKITKKALLPESPLGYYLTWAALAAGLIYSYIHFAWFLGRMESGNGWIVYVGAAAIELTIISCEFGLIRPGVAKSRRTWFWSALIFFGLFSMFANAYYATAHHLRVEILTIAHLRGLDGLSFVSIPVLGSWPPVATLIISLLLPAQAPRRKRKAVRKQNLELKPQASKRRPA